MADPILVLSRGDLERCVSMADAIAAVEEAFRAHGEGTALMPPKLYLALPQFDGDFRAMPSALGEHAGLKWVNAHPQNPKRHGLPSVMGVYILSDAATALPLAILDGTLLTALRTGAAAAVGTKYLCPSPKSLGLVGCGVQARYFLEAHRVLYPEIEVVAFDIRAEALDSFCNEHQARAGSALDAAACDVVCTSTPSRTPVVQSGWVREGAHINAMGADGPGKQELETALVKRARVYLDDREQGEESGEVNVPLHAGDLTSGEIAGTLGEVVAGKAAGRVGNEITIFDSTGLAIQDLAVARAALAAARAQNVGQALDLFGQGAN